MDIPSFQELQEHLKEWVVLDYIDPKDIPTIELYMDQVTTFMDKHLKGTRHNDGSKVLTKTMINNYSKNDLLPPSNKKRYSKDHIILLIYIYYMKNFLSISDIQSLLEPMTDRYFQSESQITMHDIYEDIFSLEQEYGIRVRDSIQEVYEFAQTKFDTEDDYLKTFAMITMLSYDIYEKKQIIERLIDSIRDNYVNDTSDKEEKSAKELAKQRSKTEKELAKLREKEAKLQEKATKKTH